MTPRLLTRQDHALWIVALILTVRILCGIGPLADRLDQDIDAKISHTTGEAQKLAHQIQQWKQDAQSAKTLSRTLSQDQVSRLLSPADRNTLIAQVQNSAAANRLAHFLFTLGPAHHWDGGEHFPGIQGIAVSTLDIEFDAPDDADIYAFLAALSTLSGRFDLSKLEVTRLSTQPTSEPSALNLHMKASLLWYANESGESP